MKKISLLFISAAVAAGFSCSSTGNAKSSGAYTFIKEGSEILYTFDNVESNQIKDVSQAGLTAVYSGGAASAQENSKEKYLYLDGEGAHLTLDKSILDGEGFTLSIKINPERWEYWQRVFDIGNGGDCDVWLGKDKATKALRFSCADISCFAKLPETGKWTVITVTFGDGDARIYVDGNLSQSVECSLTTERLKSGVKGLYIGRSNWNDPYFKGMIDDLFISGRVLSESEIKKLASGIIEGTAAGLEK